MMRVRTSPALALVGMATCTIVPSLASAALIPPPLAFSGIATIAGGSDGVASMVILRVDDDVTAPDGLVATTVIVLTPSLSGVVGVTCQLPSGLVMVTVLTSPPGKVTVTVSPGVPKPWMLGVLSRVTKSPSGPVSDAGSRAATGVMVMFNAGDCDEIFPATS